MDLIKQKKFLKRNNRTIEEHYYLNNVVKDDLSNFNDNLAYRDVDALSFMKKDIKAN